MTAKAVSDHSHGTKGGYNQGCRCTPCEDANNATNTASRHRAHKKETPDHVHGTPNGRNYWGCTCQPCVDANKAACKERREKRKS